MQAVSSEIDPLNGVQMHGALRGNCKRASAQKLPKKLPKREGRSRLKRCKRFHDFEILILMLSSHPPLRLLPFLENLLEKR